LQKKRDGYQLNRLAEHFKRDPGLISKGVKGVEKKLAEDRPFAQAVEMKGKTLIRKKKPKIVN
jgi:hypothetical protein